MSLIPQHDFKAEDLIREGRTTKSNVEEIRKWLSFNTKIPPVSDEQIVLFLLACNNDLEQTKHTIESFFQIKASSPELFTNRDINHKDVKYSHTVSHIVVFPKRTKDNYMVGLGVLKDTTYYNFCIEPQIKSLFAALEGHLYTNPPSGLIFIIDVKGVGIMHLTRLKLGPLKKFFHYVQEALPVQLKEVHILNANYIMEKILAMCKPFMKKELYEMLITHPPNTNMQDFFEDCVPASCMPSNYGGELGALDELHEESNNYLTKLKTFYEIEEKQIQQYNNA
ncbi:unnamed protein product [Diabrotica balteata]|uniref:CRAL-TRIO domain-containing protein n=1 Tax=Diabrotica balteata TaxID=107213 RepID=A0A9N9SZJ1_DIABA|nr:unnamed protein product [Diabrotica balteata]